MPTSAHSLLMMPLDLNGMQIIQSISHIAGNVTRSTLETIQCLLIRLTLLLTVFKRSGLFLALNLSSGLLSPQLVLVVRVIG
jgi:hypothetical protein